MKTRPTTTRQWIAYLLKMTGIAFGVLTLAVVGIGLLYLYSIGAFIDASDIQFENPALAVQDARQLIAAFRSEETSNGRGQHVRVEDAPKSLSIPNLRWVEVHEDHVNLILGRNPDMCLGARIWSADTTTNHADEATAYPEIYYFRYCNDLPTSPTNLY
jgi:hypothetical protein